MMGERGREVFERGGRVQAGDAASLCGGVEPGSVHCAMDPAQKSGSSMSDSRLRPGSHIAPFPSSNSGFGVLTSAYDRSQRYLPSLTAAQEALDGLLAPGQCSALVQVSCA